VRDHVHLLQRDLLDQMTLLDAITQAEPDELYNLAATSFVPASWRQPVTAQFIAVGVTSMLEAVRITKPQLRVWRGRSCPGRWRRPASARQVTAKPQRRAAGRRARPPRC